MNGIELYRGPSLIDGAPIVMIATGFDKSSDNTKTGDMIQTWILPQAEKPNDAVKSGQDSSVCGDCPHRPLTAKAEGNLSCYVKTFQGPRAVWQAWEAGKYRALSSLPPRMRRQLVLRAMAFGIRMGSWGNPSAVPQDAWEQLPLRESEVRTGYDHLWRQDHAQWMKGLVMASVSSWEEADEAEALGWKAYLFGADVPRKPPKGWTLCPEAVSDITCSKCGLCNGKRNIYVPATQAKKAWRKSNNVTV